MPLSADHEPPELFDFVCMFLADQEAGEARPLADYQRRFPGHEDAVAREYLRLHASSPRVDRPPSPPPAGERTLGPYRILRELGRGGQARVLLARDLRIGRQVALKVLPANPLLDAAHERRFRREAEAIARLDHPGICTIYEAGEVDGLRFLAMRHVPGRTLRSLLEEAEAPPSTRDEIDRVLETIEQLARALHAAHEAGIVHRDVKPENVMITPEGRPVVLDFGLARDEAETLGVTHVGEVLGTLAYMAPERLRTSRAADDRRVDVYALGALAYECLTLRQPFEAPTRAALMAAIETQDPVDPCRRNRALPPETRYVLATALAKNPSRRYATALEFAEELRRIRHYEPIAARGPGVLLRLRRWCRRHPVVAVAAAALIVGLAITTWMLASVNRERARLRGLLLAARAERLADHDPTLALLAAVESARIERSSLSNDAMLAALAHCRELRPLRHAGHEVVWTAVDPRGRWAATAALDGSVKLWDLETGRFVRRLEAHPGGVACVAFSPKGGLLATAGRDGLARLWELPAGRMRAVLEGHRDWVVGVAFDPPGGRVATASIDGTARVFDTRGRCLVTLPAGAPLSAVRFSPGGERLLTCTPRIGRKLRGAHGDGVVRVHDVRSGRLLARIGGASAPLHDARFSPRGGWVAVVGSTEGVAAWHPRDGAVAWRYEPPGVTIGARFSHDGRRLAVFYDAGVAVLDTARGELLVELDGHRHRAVADARFDASGRRLLTAGYDGTARIWSIPDGRLLDVLARSGTYVHDARWSPDGHRVVTRDATEVARLWCPGERPGLRTLRTHGAPVRRLAFSAGGSLLASADAKGRVMVFSVPEGRALATLEGHRGPVHAVRFDDRRTRLLTVGEDGVLRIQDLTHRRPPIALRDGTSPITDLAIDSRGDSYLTAHADGTARVFDADSGALRLRLRGHRGRLRRVVARPGHDEAATGGSDGTVRLFDLRTGRCRLVVPCPPAGNMAGNVYDLAFDAAGRLLAIGSEEGRVRIVDATDGEDVAPRSRLSTPGCVAFSPDGEHLLIGAVWSGTVSLIEVRSGRRDSVLRGHTNAITACAFSPDGALALSASLDGSARLWRMPRGDSWATLRGHEDAVLDAAFSPDGRFVATASRDGTVRLWPTDPLRLARERAPRRARPSELERLVRGG